jgi:small subunit ribosomal protein S13
MPRVLGVDIPNDKQIQYSLRSLFGVGLHVAREACQKVGVDPVRLANSLNEEELSRLASLLEREYLVEGPLRRTLSQNIGRLREIKCYRGVRHRLGLPVRGQRTRTNARTRKGPRKTVAGKKGVKDLK